jgi:hypothetical protein
MMFFRKYDFAAVLFGSLMSAAIAAPAAAGQYGALSAGFWKDENGVLHVTSGAARNAPSPRRAENAANDACFRDGKNCHIVRRFSHGGCGYVSVGKNPHATRFRLGATPEKAFDDCKSPGFDCNPPKGGCTSLDD